MSSNSNPASPKTNPSNDTNGHAMERREVHNDMESAMATPDKRPRDYISPSNIAGRSEKRTKLSMETPPAMNGPFTDHPYPSARTMPMNSPFLLQPGAQGGPGFAPQNMPMNSSRTVPFLRTMPYIAPQVQVFTAPEVSVDNSALQSYIDESVPPDSSAEVAIAQEFEYTPYLQLPLLYRLVGKIIRVNIEAKWMNAAINLRLSKREIWGTDVYTDDSDIVTILAHRGYFSLLKPVVEDAVVDLHVLPPLMEYKGTRTNRIESRSWSTPHDGMSIKVFRVTWKNVKPSLFSLNMAQQSLEDRLQKRLELSQTATFKV
ncbi:transcriptional regulatory protein Rxt3 [Schizosaccharomyces japonicus yFS275]|uniref:Transcriptional regulatory protein Rxt3 n=1 Tax=Schizosaccharomyces japonicus (strain yFS275 / FY16936) TaxID=402676 RepID=B6JWU3_SCHJY|nr:transcriptional regulatory protein Rxt3 [Schizosaccharomyces japonicus yFS275]EEB05844.1 transcriptional regulatory protein Rxt3 [Schizosaccharomyces japonicus yFS275]